MHLFLFKILLLFFGLFAPESYLHEFEKVARGLTFSSEQISFWWFVFRQMPSRQVRYSSNTFTYEQLMTDRFFHDHSLSNQRQEFV